MKFMLILSSLLLVSVGCSTPKEKYQERQEEAKEEYNGELKEAQEEYREEQKDEAQDMIEDSDGVQIDEDKKKIQLED